MEGPRLPKVVGAIDLLDSVADLELEEQQERKRFIAALKEGLLDIDEGRTRPIEEVYAELKAKYGF